MLALAMAVALLLGTGASALAHDGGGDSSSAPWGQPEQKSGTHPEHSGSADHKGSADHQPSDQSRNQAPTSAPAPGPQQQSNDGVSCERGKLSAWDEQWLMMSIQGDRFEIRGGKLAQKKATTQIVRDLGARLKGDHLKSLHDAIGLAKDLGVGVPDSPSPTQQWQLRVVARFDGGLFDRWYSDLEVQDHVQDIQEAQDEVDKGCNAKVRQNAADELPTLQAHLQLAQAALAASGGQDGTATPIDENDEGT